MTYKAPGKNFREGIAVSEFFKMFPDDATAEKWFIEQRWPNGVCCPHCGSLNVNTESKRKARPFRCREKECDADFSVKIGTVMQSSKIGYQNWLFAIYLISTNLKSVSSMKLRRDIGVTQKTAWHLAHRIRKALDAESSAGLFGPIEADETYFGGKRKNVKKGKREKLTGRGPVGKTAVVGLKDRATNTVRAKVVEHTDAETLQGFVRSNVDKDAIVYTDDALAYDGVSRWHETVQHSAGEYVRAMAHTNGIESFWAVLKRAHKGTFHKLSSKHLHRYIDEFVARHNMRELDTGQQMALIARKMENAQLRYKDLVA